MSSCAADGQKVFVGLTDPQSPPNVGAVLRAAGCYRVDEVFYSGSRYDSALRHSGGSGRGVHSGKTNTQREGRAVPLTPLADLLAPARAHPGMQVVVVDLVVGATPLPDFQHPESAIYIFGSEDGTVLQDVIDQADAVVVSIFNIVLLYADTN
jgi:tRNA(Leu) C34 or U34 (ribose-2'-O)-methylase TrmL